MPEKRYIFGDFELDPGDRRLTRGSETLAVSGRYFDALALLVAEAGRLVGKDRFMNEVWSGAAVTDEALTQCIRSLRRQLGDDASRPRFIETVPGHGYRFVAAVEVHDERRAAPAGPRPVASATVPIVAPIAIGGGLAGLIGGILYGSILSASLADAGLGMVSALLVVASVCTIIGGLAGLGVGLGLAASRFFPGPALARSVAGGALGGVAIGTLTKLVGVDALTLLFGVGLPGMTGGGEGLLLGAVTGLSAHLAANSNGKSWRILIAAAASGLAAGLLIHLLGGRLMAGSLDLLTGTAPQARLDLGAIGALFGEAGFGPLSRAVTAAFEGALFTGLIAASRLVWNSRRLSLPLDRARPLSE